MKRIILLFGVLIIMTAVPAQTNYTDYLDKALKEIELGNCDAAQKYYNVYKELADETKQSVEVLIEDCKKEKQKSEENHKSKFNLLDNSYCHANKNRYVAWGIAGAGYPWKLITSIEFRGGNVIGVGLYGDIGMDFTNLDYAVRTYDGFYRTQTLKTSFRYAGGLRFFPYRGLFVDFGYGTIATSSITLDGYYLEDSSAKKAVKSSHGLLFHAGYNLVTDLSAGVGFFLGVSGGTSYDVINKEFAPSVNLKLGIAWGWEK